MAHLSENVKRLSVKMKESSLVQESDDSNVWFINLPYFLNKNEIPAYNLYSELNKFISRLDRNATIIILSSPIFAADYLSNLSQNAHYKLWISIKLKNPILLNNKLAQHHAALVVITKYNRTLVHTKTRIGYTFCPSCEKTTKDYGGKKHLYNEYGTLISDVWRDISIELNQFPHVVVDRLQDLFGVYPYKNLNVIDLSTVFLPVTINDIFQKELSEVVINKLSNSLLLNGDCLEELAKIPSDSIDFCFADPPYNIKKNYESWEDDIDIIDYFNWCDKWLSELARVLKPGKILAVLNIPQWTIRHYKHLITKLDFYDWIVWEGLSLPVRMIMPANYSIVCFSKGKADPIPGLQRKNHSEKEYSSLFSLKEFFCSRSSCIKNRTKNNINFNEFTTNLWWDIHRLKHNSRRVDHPTQLPPKFMQRLISLFTDEQDFVLDPFNGSGTTTLVAEQLRRNYIGIELSEYYYGISKKRHSDLEQGIDPFGKNDTIPKAKNSYVVRLKKQVYEVDKKTLQLDVKRIAIDLGKIPNREEVIIYGRYPIDFYDNYFINWSEVTAAARTTGMQLVESKVDYAKQLRFFEERKAKYDSNNDTKN